MSGKPVQPDYPISRVEDDLLGRTSEASAFARQILSLDASRGLVAGVLGPWGSGKTSFVNLARDEFRKAEVPFLDFNPWLFSGTEQLVDFFFSELSSQLKVRAGLSPIASQLKEYGQALEGLAWLPVAGAWLGRLGAVSKVLKALVGSQQVSASSRKKSLKKALLKLPHPIVVVLDDIDRLTAPEVREVFRLVRLVADFPNVLYVLAFERDPVETALAPNGRQYLEKILQLAYDLPGIPEPVLRKQLLSAIEDAFEGRDGPFDHKAWVDVFFEVVLPFFRNMRDVRRYAIAVRAAVDSLKSQVEMTDILALESVRMFLPQVFGKLHSMIPALTETSDLLFAQAPDQPRLRFRL